MYNAWARKKTSVCRFRLNRFLSSSLIYFRFSSPSTLTLVDYFFFTFDACVCVRFCPCLYVFTSFLSDDKLGTAHKWI